MYADFLRKDMRLVLLRILLEMPQYQANSSVLLTMVNQLGHSALRDQLKAELRWLEDKKLITVEDVLSVMLCRLSPLGQDVVEGLAVVDGVARPRA